MNKISDHNLIHRDVLEITETEIEDTDLELSEDDLQQVQRVDRRVRRKLEWLIDKRDNKRNRRLSPCL